MQWYCQVRVSTVERAASRVLQVLETQRTLPERFEAQRCHAAMHIRFCFHADEKQAGRIGWLLRRAHAVTSAHWIVIRNPEHERHLWSSTALATFADADISVDLDPCSASWQTAPSTLLVTDNTGKRQTGHDTEVRMRWTKNNLYLLFDCAFQDLSLRPGEAMRTQPTPALWEHDVAELFLSVGANSCQRYAEYEVSPRGEWIDLDITAENGAIQRTSALRSGFTAAAELQHSNQRWLAFLRIPMPTSTAGDVLRMNLFRSQGTQPLELAWQPTHHVSFHVPSRFGYLELLED